MNEILLMTLKISGFPSEFSDDELRQYSGLLGDIKHFKINNKDCFIVYQDQVENDAIDSLIANFPAVTITIGDDLNPDNYQYLEEFVPIIDKQQTEHEPEPEKQIHPSDDPTLSSKEAQEQNDQPKSKIDSQVETDINDTLQDSVDVDCIEDRPQANKGELLDKPKYFDQFESRQLKSAIPSNDQKDHTQKRLYNLWMLLIGACVLSFVTQLII